MPSRAIHLLSLFVCKVVSLHTYRPLGVTPYLHVCAYTRQQAQQRDRVKALQACNICMVLAICNVHVDHMDLHPDALALSKEPRQIHKNYVLFFFFSFQHFYQTAVISGFFLSWRLSRLHMTQSGILIDNAD